MAGYKERTAWSAPWPEFCPHCEAVMLPRLCGYCDVCDRHADGEKA